MRADFLLNFQRPPSYQRPQQNYAAQRRSRPTNRAYRTPVAFVKGRFVQSAFRLYVDEVTADVVEAAFSADALLDWGSVLRVDLLTDQPPKCPICLEVDTVVPKITKCGHIFCVPCVMRYFMHMQDYNNSTYQRCPVCNEQASPEDLTTVRFQITAALGENDTTRFILAHRDATSTVVRLAANANPASAGPRKDGSLLSLPQPGDEGWRLSRVVRFGLGEADQLFEAEVQALEAFRVAASDIGETELLPSIDAARLLLERQDAARRTHRSEGLGGSEGWGTFQEEEEEFTLPGSLDVYEFSMDGDACAADAAVPPEVGAAAASSASLASMQGADGASPAQGPSQAARAPTSGGSPDNRGASHGISFYQDADGRLVYLQPFFVKLLLHEYGGRWDKLPSELPGVKIERISEVTVSEEVRKRHRFLAHLPLGSLISFAEVDLRQHLSNETKEQFAEEFMKRRQQRKKDQLRAKKDERLAKSRAAEEEERYYQALNITTNAVVQHVPTAEDFSATLPGRSNPELAGSEAGDEPAADAETAGDGGDKKGPLPTLADKIKEKMSSQKKKVEKAVQERAVDQRQFPTLGGGSGGREAGGSAASCSSAWGKGRGSDRVAVKGLRRDGNVGLDEDATQEAEAACLVGSDQPTFGEALEAALQRSTAASSTTSSGAGANKKGKKSKGTKIQLFG